jgi:hypothetical protein
MPLLTAGFMGACVYVTYLAVHARLSAPACLALLIVEGVAIYLGAWRLLRREYIPGLWRLLSARG